MNLLAALAFDEGFTKRLLGQKDTGHFYCSEKGQSKTERVWGVGRERAGGRASFVDDCARVRQEEGEEEIANLVLPGWKEHKV